MKILKVTPNNIDPGSGEVVLDFYSLDIEAKALKDARYLVIKYRYECPPGNRNSGDKMAIGMMPSGGALNAWGNINSQTPVVSNNWWGVVIFNISEFETKIVPKDGNVLKQLHFRPFGREIDPKTFTDCEYICIGDMEFWSAYPEVYKEVIDS